MTENHEIKQRLIDNIQSRLIGNADAIELLLIAMISGGHVLLEDDPGSGKTALSRALSDSLDLNFKRVQCTPDLLPSDLTGLSIYQPDTKAFKFMKGPLFTEILLADELNRATPRTQSALLEAMAEKQITVDGTTRLLPEFFLVIATQNPLETGGTFALPEAQLDRFLFQLSLPKLSLEQKDQMLELSLGLQDEEDLPAIFNREELTKMRASSEKVHIHPELRRYLIELCNGAVDINGVVAGISNRGLLNYAKACQTLAFLSGRTYVIPEDIQKLAVPVLAHRLFYRNPLTATAQKEAAIENLLSEVRVPTENWKEG